MIKHVKVITNRNLPEFKFIKESLFLNFWLKRRNFILSQIWNHINKRFSVSIKKHSIFMLFEFMFSREHPSESWRGKFCQSWSGGRYSLVSSNQKFYYILLAFIRLHLLVSNEVIFNFGQIFFSFANFLFFKTLFLFPIFFNLLEIEIFRYQLLS